MSKVTNCEDARRIQSLLWENGDAVIAVDAATGQVIDANPAALSLIGRTRDEVLTMVQARLHPNELAAEVSAAFSRAREPGSRGELLETELLHADGRRVPVELRASVSIDARGSAYGLGIFRELSERQRADAALRESERRLRAMLEAIPAAIWLSSSEHTKLDYLSSHFTRLLGYTLADLPSTERWYELAFPDPHYRQEVIAENRREYEKALRDRSHNIILRRLITCKDGTQRHVLWHSRNLDGHMLGSGFDLTDTLMAEERRREADAILRATLNGLSAHICVLDERGEILLTNRAYRTFALANGGDLADLGEGTNYLEVCERVVGPDASDAARFAEGIRAVSRGELEHFEMEYPCHSADQLRCFVASVTPTVDGPRRVIVAHSDITLRRLAERERIEANTLFQALAANVPGVLYQYRQRPDGTSYFPFASGRLREVHGVSPEQVVHDATPMFDSVHPEDIAHIREAIATSARTLAPFCAQYRVCLPDGRTIWVESESTPEALPDDSILWHGHSRDITTRVETERELLDAQARLQRSERLLRDIESISRSGGWEHLLDSQEVYWTDELYAIHELPPQSMDHVAASLRCYRPEDRGALLSAFERCVREGVGYDLELPFTTYRGNERWVRTKTQAVIEGGRVVRVVGSVMDITDRKQAEAELLLVTKAVEQSAGTVLITDPEGLIRYVNPAFTKSSGYTREEALGKNPRFLQSGVHDAEFYREMWSAIGSGRDWTGRTTNRRKDGSLYTEEAAISPVRDALGRIVNYIATKRDITEQLRAEHERLAMQEQLHQAQKLESIGRLAGGVAHDFNNLLMVILTCAELARDELGEADPLREDLQEILDAGQRAADLTRQLLAFSRKQTLAPEVLDLNRLIEGLKKILGRVIGEHISLELALAEELDSILADPGQLEQVFMNLVINARDAMPGGGLLRIATANAYRGRPGVLVTVTDTGCGMSPEVLQHIFEPFYTTKPLGGGTGLGLSTVLGIVKQSGGDIECSSEPDKGTTFEMFFPSTALTHRPMSRRSRVSSVTGRGEKILVVEDEEALRRMIQRLLVAKGYAVTAASNAGEALLLVEERGLSPDLVLADLVMPIMSGKELVERLRRRHPHQRALFMSGYAEAPMIPEGLGDASTPFLHKPFSSEELERRVREALDGERLKRDR